MAAQANIKAVITAEDRASRVLKGFSSSVAKAGKMAAVGIGALAATTVAGGIASVKAWEEQDKAIKQLNAVLTSTKGVAGVTSKAAQDLSTNLQKVTTYADENILSGENLLLTFTKIGKDVFPQATETMLDMSTALGQDLKSSAIQIGKALQDPILGITALRRVGVNFSDAQKEVVKRMVETGHQAEAQKYILKELQTEFGGSAEAARHTFGGSLKALKNQIDDVMEIIGKLITDRMAPFITKAAEFVASIDWEKVTQRTINTISSFINALTSLYRTLVDYLSPGINNFINTLQNVAKIIINVLGPPFAALISTLQDRLFPQIIALWNAIQPGFTTALQILAKIVGAVLLVAMWAFINSLNVAISIIGGVIRVVSNLIKWFGNLAGTVINAGNTVYNFVVNVFKWFKDLGSRIVSPFKNIANSIISPFRSAFNAIAHLWNSTVAKISFKAPSWVPKLGGKGWSVPSIPEMAEGGIVTKPTLALVGEAGPEAVIPLKKQTDMGSTINLNVNVGMYAGTEIEKRKMAKEILRALEDLAALKGTTLGRMIG